MSRISVGDRRESADVWAPDLRDARWLLSVIDDVPPEAARRAMGLAAGIDSPVDRFVALTRLARISGGPAWQEWARVVEQSLREIPPGRASARAAIELYRLDPRLGRRFLADAVRSAKPTGARDLAAAIQDVIEVAPTADEALGLAYTITEEPPFVGSTRSDVVADAVVDLVTEGPREIDARYANRALRLSERLPAEAGGELITRLNRISELPARRLAAATRRLTEAAPRARTYFELAQAMNVEMPVPLWKSGLHATRAITPTRERSQHLIDVAPFLPDEVTGLARDIAHGIDHAGERGRALRALDAAPSVAQRGGEVRVTPPAKTRRPPPGRGERPLEPSETAGGRRAARALGELPPRARARKLTTTIARAIEDRCADHVVSTGVSARRSPTKPVAGALRPGRGYYFWFEIGHRHPDSIEVQDVELPRAARRVGTTLDVQMFSEPGGVELDRAASRGVLRVKRGRVIVHRAAVVPASAPSSAGRLYFPIRAPRRAGRYSFRCNLYSQRTLLQSRRISVTVATDARGSAPTSRTDYTLSRRLRDRQIEALGGHDLCIMVNRDGAGMDAFRFEGKKKFAHSAHLEALDVQGLIDGARDALRKASWGTERPWNAETDRYRYRVDKSVDTTLRLTNDLVELAKQGFNLYSAIADELSGGPDAATQLQELMREPGSVHLAIKEHGKTVPPFALFYDYPLRAGRASLTVCADAIAALSQTVDKVAAHPCFTGQCSNYDNEDIVCPGGFWGFRHDIGQPVSLGEKSGTEGLSSLAFSVGSAVEVNSAFSTDPSLTLRRNHERTLATMLRLPAATLRTHFTVDDFLSDFDGQSNHLAYLYCHGGVHLRVPYIGVGPPKGDRIDPSVFRSKMFHRLPTDGSRPQPVVVINGCHTADIEPVVAMSLVAAFVKQGAAGVIGTTVTVFERLATAFGEEFVRRYVAGESVGRAVRFGRLTVLRDQLNPLGLLYVPYALSGIHLARGGRPGAG